MIAFILIYVFIAVFHMGIGGAALATTCGYLIGIGFFLLHLRRPARLLRINWNILPFILPMFTYGSSVSLSSGMKIIRVAGMNIITLALLGIPGMIIMAVCLNLMKFATMFIGGASLTIQPIGGFLYGSEDRHGINMLFTTLAILLGVLLCVLVGTECSWFPRCLLQCLVLLILRFCSTPFHQSAFLLRA